jgi:hypothetical protein
MKRAAAVFALLTVAMTWPIACHPASLASSQRDVYFNMWRLRWIAHALVASPAHLFDGNIFYPETGTLALSDAMLVEGILAAPLSWAGMKPVLVHTIMVLLPIAASGLAMFALARHLTGSRGAGLLAGIAFAYAPYRFEHLMHMELQWIVWTPMALLALHRTLETGRLRYGVATGACVALQMLSCIYYGIFLATLIVPASLWLASDERAVPWRKLVRPLLAGAALAVALSAVYAVPYLRQHARVGDRSIAEINDFSATPASYSSVPAENRLYGNRGRPGRGERRLFPGMTVVLLAVTGLLLRTPSRRAIAYLLILVAAFEASLGFGGYLYPLLYRFVPAFRGLRAMARLGMFVVMALSVLAAFGYTAVMDGRSARVRRLALAVLAGMMLAEYVTRPSLATYPNTAPPVYRFLAQQPPGVVVELPAAAVDRLPGPEPDRAYMSTFYWFPLVNGYSGNYPASYLARLSRLRHFPDATSLGQIDRDGIRYLIVHRAEYSPPQLDAIRVALADAGIVELGHFDDGEAGALIFLAR